MSFFYSAGDLYRIAAAYGEQGRRAYVRTRFAFDLVWPLVYAFFMARAISWVFSRIFAPKSPWRRANLIPLQSALFDYLENVSTALVMIRYPDQTMAVDVMAPVFTVVKWGLLGASFVLLLGGLVILAWRWARENATRTESGSGRPL